jgi:CheY-like chemotaxis protein
VKILIADDDDSVRRLLAAEIRSLGHEVIEAADGLEAVEAAESSAPGVVFLDVLMPRLNGFDALARLRSGGYAGKVVIITALSSSTTKRLEAGVLPDAMLAKPFRRRDVAKVLQALELAP